MAYPRFVTAIHAIVLPDISIAQAAPGRFLFERNVIGNSGFPDINCLS